MFKHVSEEKTSMIVGVVSEDDASISKLKLGAKVLLYGYLKDSVILNGQKPATSAVLNIECIEPFDKSKNEVNFVQLSGVVGKFYDSERKGAYTYHYVNVICSISGKAGTIPVPVSIRTNKSEKLPFDTGDKVTIHGKVISMRVPSGNGWSTICSKISYRKCLSIK